MIEKYCSAVQLIEFLSPDAPASFIVIPAGVDLIQELEEYDPSSPESLGIFLFDHMQEADDFAHAMAEEEDKLCVHNLVAGAFSEVIR